MKISLKRIFFYVYWSVLIIAGGLLVGFVSKSQQSRICERINICIDDSSEHDFIDEKNILDLINSESKILSKPIGSINTTLLEKIILSNPYIASTEVYSSINGDLNINVNQRQPIVRIINQNNEHFYIDMKGEFMPTSGVYTPSVLVANGYLFDSYAVMKVKDFDENVDLKNSSKRVGMLDQVYKLANYIERDTFWTSNIEQIYVNEKQEIELIPRIGNHKILLGDVSNLDEKFKKLFVFYRDGLSKTGWNNYDVINIKFRNQVVCSKINS